MKKIAFLITFLLNITVISAQTTDEQRILEQSKTVWRLIQERNTEKLSPLLSEKAQFVHMGATFNKKQELEVISSGNIIYKTIDFDKVSATIDGKTAVVLSKLTLTAVVGGNEVVNPFVVTEVYTRKGKNWQLLSLSFTRIVY